MNKLYSILFVFIFSLTGLHAQDLYIQFISGTSISYGLATVDRITFSNFDMQVHLSGGLTQNYSINSIRYYNYTPTITSTPTIINQETKVIQGFKIYPNPSTEQVNLEYELKKNTKVSISIYNSTGQQVHYQENIANVGQHQELLNIKTIGLQTGIYFVELNTSEEQFVQKLIVQ
jgi:hypothetical protein